MYLQVSPETQDHPAAEDSRHHPADPAPRDNPDSPAVPDNPVAPERRDSLPTELAILKILMISSIKLVG